MKEDTKTETIKYNRETVKTVLSVIQKEHEAESDRIKFITTKVQVMLTTSSILLTAIIFLLQAIVEKKTFVTISGSSFQWMTQQSPKILSFSILTVILAIINFLYVLGTKNYKRINYGELVLNKELIKEPHEVEARLIATYEEALRGNIPIANRLVLFYRIGSIMVMLASGMLFIVTVNFLL
jgi:hypothetical protein